MLDFIFHVPQREFEVLISQHLRIGPYWEIKSLQRQASDNELIEVNTKALRGLSEDLERRPWEEGTVE